MRQPDDERDVQERKEIQAIAETMFGFDPEIARRLAFIKWLDRKRDLESYARREKPSERT
jgi:hypothetical protein